MSGAQKKISVAEVDLDRITVASFLSKIKDQEGIEDSYCSLLVRDKIYNEGDTSLLTDVVDIRNIGEGELTVVKIPNYEKARQLVGDNNFLGSEVWNQLLSEEDSKKIDLPPLSTDMLEEIEYLKGLGQQSLLVLDLGKSIKEMEALCRAKGINVLNPMDRDRDKLRAEACYSAAGPAAPRWLLLPGSDHGVLPGSRNKSYADQVKYMEANYPGYEVGAPASW